MNKWEREKQWSDRLLPHIKRILGEQLISEPPVEEDMRRNTDLIVLKLDAIRIACRVRRYQYLAAYGDEFTIRAALPSGTQTELSKIIEGWGQYLFYGFATQEETELAAWVLGDLNAFRLWFNRCLYRKPPYPWKDCKNGDGSSSFLAFRYSDIPGFVVANSIKATP